MKSRVAKILEIGPYPPPLAGWSIRIKFVLDHLRSAGHDCRALNIGKNRKIPSDEYITVKNRLDYVWKTFCYAFRGYTIHMHTNGDGPIGLKLAIVAAVAGCLSGRRMVLSFHAGTEQVHFPIERSGDKTWMFRLIFKFSKKIVCNNEAVKEKIVEYGINPDKIVPIRAFSTAYLSDENVPLPKHVEASIKQRDPLIYTYVFLRHGFHLETFVSGVRRLVDRYPNIGIVSAGSIDDYEAPVRNRILKQIEDEGVGDHIVFAGDLTHDEFLSLSRQSKLYLRTPTTDGESASVLEALTLGIPVVAAENHARPESVVTYQHDDPDDLCRQVSEVLENHQAYCDKVVRPAVRDTVSDEAMLLVEASLGKRAVATAAEPAQAAAPATTNVSASSSQEISN